MITQITRAPDAPGDAALRAMFAARKQVFIDQLKWDLPALDGRYEIDHFDDENARYLILLDHNLRHRASVRLLPTTAPCLLGELFPWLCTDGPPAGPTIWEISRFCLDPGCSAEERRDARNQLVTALAGYALLHGITDYVGVAEKGWFDKIVEFGWKCKALGAPWQDAAGAILALQISIDEDTEDGLKRAGIYAPQTLHLEACGEIAR
jgi:acyl homoserine lactone synthase/acyl-homoserine lactone synthase